MDTLTRTLVVAQDPTFATFSRRLRSVAVVLSRLFRLVSDRERQSPPTADDLAADGELLESVSALLADLAVEVAAVRTGLSTPQQAEATTPHHTNGQGDSKPAAAAVAPPNVSAIEQRADDLAQLALDVEFEHLIDRNEDAWRALLDAVRRRTCALDGRGGDEDTMDVYTRLLTALPSDLKRDFRRFAEAHALESIVERNAAFEVGRRVERHVPAPVHQRREPVA